MFADAPQGLVTCDCAETGSLPVGVEGVDASSQIGKLPASSVPYSDRRWSYREPRKASRVPTLTSPVLGQDLIAENIDGAVAQFGRPPALQDARSDVLVEG